MAHIIDEEVKLMAILLGLIVSFGLASALLLFRHRTIPHAKKRSQDYPTISVIIPARNEERNLPHLLESLKKQTIPLHEVIVVDDHSRDRTRSIAESYGVKVLTSPELPAGWTGKSWALWNGYRESSGELLIFLDADVRLSENAIESLVQEQQRQGGVISVVPYHITEKSYERWAMVINLLAAFVFTSPFENRNPQKGMFGACIVASRADYEKIDGHRSISSEVLDDLRLGARFQAAGIRVSNYLGSDLILFRMYPGGFRSELEGFAKSAIPSTYSLHPFTLLLVALWLVGLIASQSVFFLIGQPVFPILVLGYVAYTVEILYFSRRVGKFGYVHPVVHVISLLFFLVVIGYSLYQSVLRKKVIWKGRYIEVGRDES